jgi:hypothetical protein
MKGTIIAAGYNPPAISYDPVTQSVVGSIYEVPTPALHYAATGIKYVGIECASFSSGIGTVDDFMVQAGSITPAP